MRTTNLIAPFFVSRIREVRSFVEERKAEGKTTLSLADIKRAPVIATKRITEGVLPKKALLWIHKLRSYLKANKPSLPDYPTVTNRNIFRIVGGHMWLVDMRNAYLHVAQSLGVVPYSLVEEAYYIREKYDIKPAVLLGMALSGGAWIEQNGIRTETLIPKPSYFRNIANATHAIFEELAQRTDAVAWYVDALLYDKIPPLSYILDLMRIWLRLPVHHIRFKEQEVVVTPSYEGHTYVLRFEGEGTTWRVCPRPSGIY